MSLEEMLHLSGCILLPYFSYQDGSWAWAWTSKYLWWQEGRSGKDGPHVLAAVPQSNIGTGHLLPGHLNLLTFVQTWFHLILLETVQIPKEGVSYPWGILWLQIWLISSLNDLLSFWSIVSLSISVFPLGDSFSYLGSLTPQAHATFCESRLLSAQPHPSFFIHHFQPSTLATLELNIFPAYTQGSEE